MLQALLYFLIAIGATTVGSMTGTGGGVIIKPLLDVIHGFDVETISLLSSITVFSMSVVSVGKHLVYKTEIPHGTAVSVAMGAVAGGFLGQKILTAVVAALGLSALVTVVQNVILFLLILWVYLYMKKKEQIQSLHLGSVGMSFLVGIFLGICSAFLGIGGGPINVALIIFLFSFDTKTATVCSLVIILFAQLAKLGTVVVTGGLGRYDLSMAPVMVLGAVSGGALGSFLNKKLSEGGVEHAFQAVQLIVLSITAFNIVKNLGFL